MDGTLFDSMRPVNEAFVETILAAGGPRYAHDEIVAAFPKGSSDRMLDHLLGRPVTATEAADYHRRLEVGAAALIPYDGIPQALDALGRDVRLALFTGADRTSLALLLERTALRDRFEVVTGGDEIDHAKPAPDGILLTCERLDLDPKAAAYVGDSGPDMEAATAAGALAIGAAWGSLWSATHPADEVARTPLDIAGIVASR